jgi:hypothetical protein
VLQPRIHLGPHRALQTARAAWVAMGAEQLVAQVDERLTQ